MHRSHVDSHIADGRIRFLALGALMPNSFMNGVYVLLQVGLTLYDFSAYIAGDLKPDALVMIVEFFVFRLPGNDFIRLVAWGHLIHVGVDNVLSDHDKSPLANGAFGGRIFTGLSDFVRLFVGF